MTTFPDLVDPSFTWPVIEQALRDVPMARWEAAARFGCCAADAATMIRATVADDLRRELEKRAGRALTANSPPCESSSSASNPAAS